MTGPKGPATTEYTCMVMRSPMLIKIIKFIYLIIYLAWLRHIHVIARSPGWKSHDIDHMFVVITSEHVRHGHMLIEMLHYT